LGVTRAEAAGDALDEDFGAGFDEDGHEKFTISDLRFSIAIQNNFFCCAFLSLTARSNLTASKSF
jgi:hypothetical protein